MSAADEVFDVCVVGAGLWGSAAAKYCSERSGTSVCLIGPSEPSTKEDYEGRSIFGAHYDEGRIVGATSNIFEWGQLTKRGAEKLRNIEEMSGVHFFNNVGMLWLTEHCDFSQKLLDVSNQTGINVEFLDQNALQQKYNFLSSEKVSQEGNMKRGVVGLSLATDAGHLSPRKLLLAQQILAERQGCKIFDDVVNGLSHNHSRDLFSITTIAGNTIKAKNVLLCTGASTMFENLLPTELQPDLSPRTQVVVFLKLREDDRQRLCDMPTIICEGERDYGKDCYILPPIQYPDGKWYLKIGHGKVGEVEVTSEEQLKAWYCGEGDPSLSERLLRYIQGIIPDMKPCSIHSATCVTTNTSTGNLYCDMISPGLGMVVGGNGQGAAPSDEIGRMGANMILKGEWDYDMPQERFRVQWKPKEDSHA